MLKIEIYQDLEKECIVKRITLFGLPILTRYSYFINPKEEQRFQWLTH